MSQKKETGVLRRSVEAVVESAATRGVNVTADELFKLVRTHSAGAGRSFDCHWGAAGRGSHAFRDCQYGFCMVVVLPGLRQTWHQREEGIAQGFGIGVYYQRQRKRCKPDYYQYSAFLYSRLWHSGSGHGVRTGRIWHYILFRHYLYAAAGPGV